MKVLFGPSGGGEEAVNNGITITKMPEFIKSKGLDAFEYSFGHGYTMSIKTALLAGLKFKQHDIKLSLHAPFFINFANPDEVMYQKSAGYLYTGIKFLRSLEADKLVFHAASCGKQERADAYKLTVDRIHETLDKMEEEKLLDGIFLCPETMGKTMQIGTYKEIIDLCTVNEHLTPTFDFGHINCLMQGELKQADDYKRIFDYAIEKLGFDRASNCHIHFSKIQFGEKGEIRHLNYTEDEVYGPIFDPLAEVLIDYKLSPRVITESMSNMVDDAILLKKIYNEKLK